MKNIGIAMRTIATRVKKRLMLRSFLLFAAVAAIAIPLIAVKAAEHRRSHSYTCVGQGCYKVIQGKRVWVTDWQYERRWRVERGRTRSVFDVGFDHLAGALDAWTLYRTKNQEPMTEEEQQRFAERRKQLLDRIAAKRAARRAGMEAFIAARTGDPGNIAAKQPPN